MYVKQTLTYSSHWLQMNLSIGSGFRIGPMVSTGGIALIAWCSRVGLLNILCWEITQDDLQRYKPQSGIIQARSNCSCFVEHICSVCSGSDDVDNRQHYVIWERNPFGCHGHGA